MSKYIKLFNNHSEYEAFKASEDYVTPNVSHCIEENEVHYNPYVPASDPRLIVTYNVEDANSPILLYSYYAEPGGEDYWTRGVDMFDKVEIDGTEVSVSSLDANSGTYQFSTGEHTVAYTLKNPTLIGYDPNDPEEMAFGALFMDCESITNVVIPNSVITIGGNAFQNCLGLISITIPNSITSIGRYAFKVCSLSSVTIPDSVTTIGKDAFYQCSSLTSVAMGNGVTSIGDEAFQECSSLTSVTIGSGVTTIKQSAFAYCSSLIGVTVKATTPPTLENVNAFNITNDCPIYVPSESVNAYKTASVWSSCASRIQAIQ